MFRRARGRSPQRAAERGSDPREGGPEENASPRKGFFLRSRSPGKTAVLPGGGDEKRVTVHVEVMEARGLGIADKKTQASDPFVETRLGKEKFRTSVKEKTLEPLWEEKFEFGKGENMLRGDEVVLVHILDRDFVFNDDLGGCAVPLPEVTGIETTEWYKLKHWTEIETEFLGKNQKKAKKKKESKTELVGEIKIRVRVERTSVEEETKTEVEEAGGIQKSQQQEGTPSSLGKFRIAVLRAKGLKAGDKNGKSDPYCVIQYGKKKFKTKTIRRTLAPTWKEIFEICEKENGGDFVLKIYDDDYFSDTPLGSVKLQTEMLKATSKSPSWFKLDEGTGEVELGFEYVVENDNGTDEKDDSSKKRTSRRDRFFTGLRSLSPVSRKKTDEKRVPGKENDEEGAAEVVGEGDEDVPPETKPLPESISIALIRGKGLKGADKNGSSDPYVILKLGREKFKSKKVKKSLDPDWNETFTFSKSETWTWETMLLIKALDADLLSSDVLGQAEIALSDLEATEWIPLRASSGENAGEVKLKNTFHHVKGDAKEITALELIVLEGQNLAPSDRSGLCDPYCVVIYKNDKKTKKFKTPVLKKTLNPVWTDCAFELVDRNPSQKVLIKVMDKDLLGSELIGQVEIEADEAFAIGTPEWYELEPNGGKIKIEVRETTPVDNANLAKQFDNVLNRVQNQLRRGNQSIEHLRSAFKLYDKDNSGMMDRNELKNFLEFFHLSDDLNDEDVEVLLDALDANGDGSIQINEVEMLLKDLSGKAEAAVETGQSEESTVATTLQRIVDCAVTNLRKLPGNQNTINSELLDDFINAFKNNAQLFDEESTGFIGSLSRFNRVLQLSNACNIVLGENEFRSLEDEFGQNLNYHAFCDKLLQTSPEISKLPSNQRSFDSRENSESLDGELKLKILQGRGFSGVNGVYVTAKIGRDVRKTKAVKKSKDIVWNEEFAFPSSSSNRQQLKFSDLLHVQVRDKDMFSSNLIGEITIPLSKIGADRSPKWFELDNGGEGEIKLSLKLILTSGQRPLSPPLQHVDDYIDGMEFGSSSPASSIDSSKGKRRGGKEEESSHDFATKNNKLLREARMAVGRCLRDVSTGRSLRNELQALDLRKKGYISSRKLRSGLENFGLHLTMEQLDAILPRVDPEGVDHVDYALLCKILRTDEHSIIKSTHESKYLSQKALKKRVGALFMKAQARRMNFASLFFAFDTKSTGKISIRDCWSVLMALGGELAIEELSDLLNALPCVLRDGDIKYEAFVQECCPSIDIEDVFVRSSLDESQFPDFDKLLNKVKGIFRKIPDVSARFERVDFHGTGKVSRGDFREVLDEIGVHLEQQEVRGLTTRFASEENGMINYQAFCEACETTQDELEQVVDRFRRSLQEALLKTGDSLVLAFHRLDLEGSGKISRRDFRRTLEKMLPEALQDEEYLFLMDKFDSTRSGQVLYKPFVEYVHGRALIDDSKQISRHQVAQILRDDAPMRSSLLVVPQEVHNEKDEPRDIWHPQTITEWLTKYASESEKRDFYGVYQSMASHDNISSRANSASPTKGFNSQKFRRSPSPMDRDCRKVGWSCKKCKHVNNSVWNLNQCSRCGKSRSASSKVVLVRDQDSTSPDAESDQPADELSGFSSPSTSSLSSTSGDDFKCNRNRRQRRNRSISVSSNDSVSLDSSFGPEFWKTASQLRQVREQAKLYNRKKEKEMEKKRRKKRKERKRSSKNKRGRSSNRRSRSRSRSRASRSKSKTGSRIRSRSRRRSRSRSRSRSVV